MLSRKRKVESWPYGNFPSPAPQTNRAKRGFRASLFLAILLALPYCADIRSLFTKDRNPGPLPDPGCLGEAEGDFQAGEGTKANPYLISTYKQLKDIRGGLNKHYALTDNIDACPSRKEGLDGCTAYDGRNADTADCAGWMPLGDGSTKFTGSFDGRGYVISKLYANVFSDSGDAYAGFFGYVGTGAFIRDVGLTELRVTADASGNGSARAGGLAGVNRGAISSSYAAGSVAASTADSSKNAYAGGLVGRNESGGKISNSYAAGSVEAKHSGMKYADVYVGGLVGLNTSSSSTISNSYATGSVKAKAFGYAFAGGLAGKDISSTIRDSYATGSVESHSSGWYTDHAYAGGLVGDNVGGRIENSYATGSVAATRGSTAGDPYAGGFAGWNRGGIIDSYYDTETTGLRNACGLNECSRIVGLTTAEMQTDSGTYPDMLEGTFFLGDGYPKLYQCEINPATNACVFGSFLYELVPGQTGELPPRSLPCSMEAKPSCFHGGTGESPDDPYLIL